MTFGKLVCGFWLLRLSIPLPQKGRLQRIQQFFSPSLPHFWGKRENGTKSVKASTTGSSIEMKKGNVNAQDLKDLGDPRSTETSTEQQQSADDIELVPIQVDENLSTREVIKTASKSSILTSTPKKPISLYPASILGLAMVARGEIGFLISSLAESNGIFASTTSDNDEIFLIVTWAIVLCTVIGPVGVGLLVRRVKRLEKEKEGSGGGRDVLGVWGVG
jgi:hypothetical protein